jgi:hypothetical protein
MDPFSLVYDALWTLAENSVVLTELVRVGNRIKFNHTGHFDPIKHEASEGDLPELVLVSTGCDGNLNQTSCSSMFTRRYEWLLATGDLSVVNRLLPLEFALFCAMSDWPAVVNALQWNGKPFCKRTGLTNVNNGLTDPERNRGIRGWSAIWSLEVEMHFMTSELVAYGAAPTTTSGPTTT